MTVIRLQDGKPILEAGKVGSAQECCCGGDDGCCSSVTWHRVHGACNNLPDDFLVSEVDENCYAYYTWEDWDCVNPLTGRDCGDPDGACNIYARVKITGNTPGVIEYLQSGVDEEDSWGPATPGGRCDCPDSFGSLSVGCSGACCVEGGCYNGLTQAACEQCTPVYECVGSLENPGLLVENCADCPDDTSFCGDIDEGVGTPAGYNGYCGEWRSGEVCPSPPGTPCEGDNPLP